MSEFDKEAEREKLRERFAEEEEERETTERMSELLLQGATMTDIHCDECGNPLFRYDGQTFCSSCQRTVEAGDTTGNAVEESTTEPTDAVQETPNPSTANRQIPVTDPREGTAGENQRPQPGAAQQNEPSDPVSTPETPQRTPADGLAATEASLSRTLRRQADAAERAEDLSRTRKHLAAAREAAEALDAVRSAR